MNANRKNKKQEIASTAKRDPLRGIRHARYDRGLAKRIAKNQDAPREIPEERERFSAPIADILNSKKGGCQK